MLNPALSADGGFDDFNVVDPNVNAIAAAATIAPKNKVTRVTGTVPVATITPPTPYFNGPLHLYSSDASPFTTVTQYRLLSLVFDPSVNLWFPSY